MFFASTKSALKTAEQFAAQQRAREIAATGHSKIAPAPKKKRASSNGTLTSSIRSSSKSNNETESNSSGTLAMEAPSVASNNNNKGKKNYHERQQELRDQAVEVIEEAQRGQALKLKEIESNIMHHAEMAEARLEYSHNTIGACLSMNTVKVLQQDFILVCKKLEGLQVLKENIENDFAMPSHVHKDIEEILTTDQRRDDKSYKDTQLLEELRKKKFVPPRPKFMKGL